MSDEYVIIPTAWLDQWLERVKAEAWDEGYVEGVADETIRASIDRGTREAITNPYRQEQTNE